MKTLDFTFQFLGNNTAVDFANSQVLVRSPFFVSMEATNEVLTWIEQAGLTVDVADLDANLHKVTEFRNGLKAIFAACIDEQEPKPKHIALLNRYLPAYSQRREVKFDQGQFVLDEVQHPFSVDEFLGFLAHEAANLLASPQVLKLKRCSNEKCILIYVDKSKSGRRRWCSMEICGNRAKAANHYHNSKQAKVG